MKHPNKEGLDAIEFVISLASELVGEDRRSIEKSNSGKELQEELELSVLNEEKNIEIAFAALECLKVNKIPKPLSPQQATGLYGVLPFGFGFCRTTAGVCTPKSFGLAHSPQQQAVGYSGRFNR